MRILRRLGGPSLAAGSAGGRRGLKITGITLIASAGTLLFAALPAGATDAPAANNVIIGSGSQAAYAALNTLESLFNAAPGCPIFVPVPNATDPQEEDFSCVTAPTTTANPENPYNDVATEEPPLGSSTGISQLENSGAHGATATSSGTAINVFQGVNFATSARTTATTDLKGLNFVAYAEDGVSWFNYTEVGSVATPSAAVTNLTQAQLIGIYKGTYTNWDQVGGANAPIVVFSAQEGAGVQSVWKTFLGFDPTASTNQVNCFVLTPPGTGSPTCVGPAAIGQNEDAQISPAAFTGSQSGFTKKTNPDWGGKAATLNEIKADAIYFFSYGDYAASCKLGHGENCGGSRLAAGSTNAIESVNGVAPNEQTILDGQFPVDHYLYNVYSDGSNANIPAATAATLNFASEIGFICNPNKGGATNLLDPSTGTAYLSELQTDILNSGFFPLSGAAAVGSVNTTPIDEGTVTNPASNLLDKPTGGQGAGQSASAPGYAQYKPFDTFAVTGPDNDPSGFCLTTTTDSNASS
jgi:ABC-type phosphate transport system substrate-binding protein